MVNVWDGFMVAASPDVALDGLWGSVAHGEGTLLRSKTAKSGHEFGEGGDERIWVIGTDCAARLPVANG